MVTSALERLIRGQYTPRARSAITAASGLAHGALASQRRLQQQHGLGSSSGVGGNPVDQPVPLEACNWLNLTACNTTGAAPA